MLFFLGFVVGAFVFEPLIINLVYLSNVALFNDIIIWSDKNRKKLKNFYN